MGLFSFFQSMIAFSECTVHLLLVRLADRNIITEGHEVHSGSPAMSKMVKRHGHSWTAIMYTFVEFVACVVFVLKHGLQGGCKVILPVVIRRTFVLLHLYIWRVFTKATALFNKASQTYLGSFAKKQVIRFTSPYVSALRLVHNAVSCVYGADYLEAFSDYLVALLEKIYLAFENTFHHCLDSFVRKSGRSILVWMLYMSTGIYFTTALCYVSLALAFMTAYTFDANYVSKTSKKDFKPETITQPEQLQQRSAFNTREAQRLRENRIESLFYIPKSVSVSYLPDASLNDGEQPALVEPSLSQHSLKLDDMLVQEQSSPPRNTTTTTINNSNSWREFPATELEIQSIPVIQITRADESLTPPLKPGTYSTLPKNNELENTSVYLDYDSIVDEPESVSEGYSSTGEIFAQFDTSGRITSSTKGVPVTGSRHQRRVTIVRSPEGDKENINNLVATSCSEPSFEGHSQRGLKHATKPARAVKGKRTKNGHQKRLATRQKCGVRQPVELRTPGISSRRSSKASEGDLTPSPSFCGTGKKKEQAREAGPSVSDGHEEIIWVDDEPYTEAEIAAGELVRRRMQERKAKGSWIPYIDEGALVPPRPFEFSTKETYLALDEQDSDEVF